MSSGLPPEDQPPAEWRRFATPDEAADAIPEPDLTDPASVGVLFYQALQDPSEFQQVLAFLTTPESQSAWDDFAEAGEMLAAIEDHGIGTMVKEAQGDPSVAYAKILRGITDSYEVLDNQIINAAAVITLVWRPDFGRWMVHGIGDSILPEDVPHG